MKKSNSKAYVKQSEKAKESIKNYDNFSMSDNRNTNLHNVEFNSNASYYEEIYNTKWKELRDKNYKDYRNLWHAYGYYSGHEHAFLESLLKSYRCYALGWN